MEEKLHIEHQEYTLKYQNIPDHSSRVEELIHIDTLDHNLCIVYKFCLQY